MCLILYNQSKSRHETTITGKSVAAELLQTHPDETLHLKYNSSINEKSYAAKRYIVINRLPNGKQEVYEYTFEEPIVPEPQPAFGVMEGNANLYGAIVGRSFTGVNNSDILLDETIIEEYPEPPLVCE